MANEFNIKNGFITSGNSNVYANLNVSGGITATTISATTYTNLPTFSGGTLTGLTINGDLTVTGDTNISGVTTFNSAPVFNNLTNSTEINALVLDASGNVYLNSNFINTINGSTGISTSTVAGVTTITNTAPDQTVTITGGTNMQVSGTYPNFGVNFTGGTVTNPTNFTGGLTANTLNISTTPTTNTTDSSVLVRNSSTGNIESRNIKSLINANNTVTVGLDGSVGVDFNSIKDAVDSITASTSANTYSVQVAGGVYYEDPFTIPSWVSVVGESSVSTIIQANDGSQTLINLSDQSALFDCQVQGCTGTSVSAIVYSSSTTPQSSAISYVENVRFGANYTHAKVVAYGGANVIMQCSNVKYGGYPFTIGFYATNSGSGIGRMQLRNVTSTNGGITTTTGLIFAKADAASCGFVVNGCLLTKAVGAAAGTGFYVENGGFLRLTAVNFQRWSVGIDAPQVGAAPSIDATALNFENNTIDVNIAHSGATGKIQGTDNFLKTIINPDAPLYEVSQDPRQITVAKKGGDFSGITEAVSYLISSGNTSSTNRYIISVGPGKFEEEEIDLTSTPYVSIVGSDILQTVIIPKSGFESGYLFILGDSNELSFMTISGMTGSGGVGIFCRNTGGFSLVHKISMYDNDTHIAVQSSSLDTQFFGEYVDLNGDYNYGVSVISAGGSASANLENHYNFATGALGLPTIAYYAQGVDASINVTVGDNIGQSATDSACIVIEDGADLNISSININGWDYGIRNPNIGSGCTFDIDGISIVNSTIKDLRIDQQFTTGTIQGSLSHQKITNNAPGVYWQFLDHDDGELDVTRKISITFEDGTHTDTSTLIFQASTMGAMTGGTITSIGGLSAQTSSGYGYLQNPSSEIFQRIDWTNSVILLGANTNNYIYINSSSILSASNTIPNNTENIILGRVVTNASTIEFIDPSPQKAQHTSNLFSTFNRIALGPVYATGSLVTQNATAFRINVSNGDYFFSENQFLPSGGSGITFTQYYRNGIGGWNTSATTFVQGNNFDNNGTLSGLTTSAYTKHTLYVLGDGAYEKYFLVLGQNQYTTLVEAENADLPTPPTYFDDAVVSIASIYVQQGASNIIEFEDIRPVIGFKAGGVNASSLHANLLGLTADDHKQYLLVDGSRSMSGSLNMSGNTITNAGTINGVTIETHAARHKSGGSDPVGTATPTASAIPYADAFGKLDGWITPITISGGTGISTGGTYPNLSISFTGGTIPSATRFTGGLSANTISATTYQNLPFSGTVINSGTTTSNFIPKWTGTTALTNSQIRDDGTSVAVGQVPTAGIKLWVYTAAASSYGIRGDGTSAGIQGQGVGTGYGVFGGASSSVGVYGSSVADTGTNIGVQGVADIQDGGSPTNIGGFFSALNGGSNYSIQLQDGSEAIGYVLVSKTSDGKANWSDTLTGLTNVRSTTISATTYQGNVVTQIVAGTNVTISPTNGIGAVTINASGGGGGGSTNYGAIYTTANNFNLI